MNKVLLYLIFFLAGYLIYKLIFNINSFSIGGPGHTLMIYWDSRNYTYKLVWDETLNPTLIPDYWIPIINAPLSDIPDDRMNIMNNKNKSDPNKLPIAPDYDNYNQEFLKKSALMGTVFDPSPKPGEPSISSHQFQPLDKMEVIMLSGLKMRNGYSMNSHESNVIVPFSEIVQPLEIMTFDDGSTRIKIIFNMTVGWITAKRHDTVMVKSIDVVKPAGVVGVVIKPMIATGPFSGVQWITLGKTQLWPATMLHPEKWWASAPIIGELNPKHLVTIIEFDETSLWAKIQFPSDPSARYDYVEGWVRANMLGTTSDTTFDTGGENKGSGWILSDTAGDLLPTLTPSMMKLGNLFHIGGVETTGLMLNIIMITAGTLNGENSCALVRTKVGSKPRWILTNALRSSDGGRIDPMGETMMVNVRVIGMTDRLILDDPTSIPKIVSSVIGDNNVIVKFKVYYLNGMVRARIFGEFGLGWITIKESEESLPNLTSVPYTQPPWWHIDDIKQQIGGSSKSGVTVVSCVPSSRLRRVRFAQTPDEVYANEINAAEYALYGTRATQSGQQWQT